MKQGLVVAVDAIAPASRNMRSLRSSLPSMIMTVILMMLAIAPDAGAQSASSQGYLLWTRSDTGQAVLWQVDPVTGGLVKSTTVGPSAGIGASWKATSIQYVSASAYVLWTSSDTGQAELWTIDPATGAKLKSARLQSEVGIGGPWQATSYYHVNSTEGYVLWSRSDLGKALLWRIDPSKLETLSVIPAETNAYLFSESGVGAPWEATSFHHVSASEGYVLWTRSDIGKANLWQIDPSLPTGPSQLKRSQSLYSASGVGAPWQATSYTHMNTTEGYVFWTRSDTGKTNLWQIDPSQPTGQGQLELSLTLNSASGMSAPWQATSYTQRELASGVVLSGLTDPTDDIGKNGDLYLNTATATLFGPKTSDGWGVGTRLVGPQGPTGGKGDTGPTGATGQQGEQGVPGTTGATGPQGVVGPTGVKGDTGSPGINGATIRSGPGDPSTGVGSDGDFYLNTANSMIFGPKSSGTWGSGTSLIGPQGGTGPRGEQGAQGVQGIQGAIGPTGPRGLQGPPGPGSAIQNYQPQSNTVSDLGSCETFLGKTLLIDHNGLPMFTHEGSGPLIFGRCADQTCSSYSTMTVDVSGRFVDMTSDSEGNVYLSYIRFTGNNPEVQEAIFAKCSTSACTSFSTTVIPEAWGGGTSTSIRIGRDGFPSILYASLFVKCQDSSCESYSTVNLNVSGASMAIGIDGLPFISGYGNNTLDSIKCNNDYCSNTTRSILENPMSGFVTKATISDSGLPIVIYNQHYGPMKYAACLNLSCSTAAITAFPGDRLAWKSITYKPGGFAYITSIRMPQGDLVLTKCLSDSCSQYTEIALPVSGPMDSIVKIGPDGYPVILKHDGNHAYYLKCANQFCAENWYRQ